MHIEHHQWFSARLGREMGLSVFGHWGAPVLAFPTSAGNEWEYLHRGLIGAVGDFIAAGRIKVFAIDSNATESFQNVGAHPFHRSWKQQQYDQYVVREVVPFIHGHCRGTPGLTAFGASLGAYYAANTLFKHPDLFRRCIALSGVFDLRPLFGHETDANFYFNNPVDYLPSLSDPWYLDQLRACDVRLVTGTGAWEDRSESYRLSAILSAKGLPHHLDDWGAAGSHDWPSWNVQVREYLGQI